MVLAGSLWNESIEEIGEKLIIWVEDLPELIKCSHKSYNGWSLITPHCTELPLTIQHCTLDQLHNKQWAHKVVLHKCHYLCEDSDLLDLLLLPLVLELVHEEYLLFLSEWS